MNDYQNLRIYLPDECGMNLVKLAKSGDITAISGLINQALNPQNIQAKVTVEHQKIIVLLESSKKLNQTEIVKYIYKGLSKLDIPTYSTLVVCGKLSNNQTIEWQQEINFNSSSPSDVITLNATKIKSAKKTKNQSFSQSNLTQKKQQPYQIVPANPNATGAIVAVGRKPSIAAIEAVCNSAKYLQIISYVIIVLSWLLISIQALFIISIIYDIFISRSQAFSTIINITDITGILSSWIEQLLYLVYKFWDYLKIVQSFLERLTYLCLIIWVYFLNNTIKKINNDYPVTPWGGVMCFSIPLYNIWGMWNVLSNLSSYLKKQNREVASKGRKIKKYLPWLYTFIFAYILIYIIYIVYASQTTEKNVGINFILYLLVDILFICRSFLYLQIINISYQAVFLQSTLFKEKFKNM
ncbi:hypothetical protein WJM97_05710 [Okeanomitos corallinicola TIOX110]|uniref:Uncharacterized protein n=1 Tax=Okeanomitos corallinicola TIOX110 TaxID=3133117 RepID=A0ABZ2UW04_9CYAN